MDPNESANQENTFACKVNQRLVKVFLEYCYIFVYIFFYYVRKTKLTFTSTTINVFMIFTRYVKIN